MDDKLYFMLGRILNMCELSRDQNEQVAHDIREIQVTLAAMQDHKERIENLETSVDALQTMRAQALAIAAAVGMVITTFGMAIGGTIHETLREAFKS